MSVFDKLDDETPPTQGQEIGKAVASAIAEVGKAGEAVTRQISAAMIEAMKSSSENKDRTVMLPSPPITRWIFDIEHGLDGRTVRVIATAERSNLITGDTNGNYIPDNA